MKINNIGQTGMNPYKNNLSKLDDVKQSSFNKKDKLEISSTAKELQHTSQVVTQRQAKVEELKISVENGTYKVNPRETAKALLNFYSKK